MITPYRQIYPQQCRTLASLGYRTLINLRCDNECDNQPCNEMLASSASQSGLAYYHLPIDGDSLLERSNIKAFAELFNKSDKPVMVFCGTGNRAKRIYQCAKIEGLVE